MRVRLKGINRVIKRLADGRSATYYYAWKGGPRLHGEPGSPEFIGSYNEAAARKVTPPRGTIFSVLQQYQASEDFRALADSTRRSYVALISRIEKRLGDFPLSALTDRRSRGIFMAWRDEIAASAGRRQADYAWTVLARVLSWSFNRGLVAANPCERGGRLYRGRARKYGPLLTKRYSSNVRQRIYICRYCSRCGPGSGRATCFACLGLAITGPTSVCGRGRPVRVSSFPLAHRSKPCSMLHRSQHNHPCQQRR